MEYPCRNHSKIISVVYILAETKLHREYRILFHPKGMSKEW